MKQYFVRALCERNSDVVTAFPLGKRIFRDLPIWISMSENEGLMAYRIGGVTVQGDEPSNVIHAAFTPKVVDGGKARIQRRRARCDLTMDHADPEDTRLSELA
jgi:hypothetical protein